MKLSVAIFGRVGKMQRGGLKWSVQLAAEALRSVGDVVRVSNVRNPPGDLDDDLDVIWVYGETAHVPELAEIARQRNIPLLVNSTFDCRSARTREIALNHRSWGRGVYPVVFTDAAAAALALPCAVIPNLFRMAPPEASLPFAERKGVCVGDWAKLQKASLTGPEGYRPLAKLHKLRPDIPIITYRQYKPETDPPPWMVLEPFSVALHGLLGRVRLFISMARFETFAMVPLEAQSCGTPVVYRPMPQSLSAYIGPTGISFGSAADLCATVQEVYDSPQLWEQMSTASLENARSKAPDRMGVAIHLALVRAVHQHRSL